MSDIERPASGAADGVAIPGEVSSTGLQLPPDLPMSEWIRCGQILSYIEDGVKWWRGDWLNFGERKYGETYAQAMDETGMEYDTLRQERYVAERVETGYRKPDLSWTHHRLRRTERNRVRILTRFLRRRASTPNLRCRVAPASSAARIVGRPTISSFAVRL